MIKRLPTYLSVLFLTQLLALAIWPPSGAWGADTDDLFADLKAQLVKDGFSAQRLDQLYGHSKTTFATKTVSLFFIHSEAKLNYDQFISSNNIRKARRYMQRQREHLLRAEADYGVDKEIITGILLVETQLGKILGHSSIFSTLSTMAALDHRPVREHFWKQIPVKVRITRTKFDKKADKKSLWAYKELKAFLKYTQREKIDPLSVSGSYAGAMGISQFMPSNILTLAKDGNGDGRVDLFDHADAIDSVANYLRHHGWRPNIERKAAYKVILRYNYSKYYANTVLRIAELLKG